MGKLILAVLLILFVASSGICYGKTVAKEKGAYLYGTVLSINEDSKLMKIKSARGDVVVDVSNAELKGYKDLKAVKQGDRIKVRYTNFGIRIESLRKK